MTEKHHKRILTPVHMMHSLHRSASHPLNQIQSLFLTGADSKNTACFTEARHTFSQNMMHFVAFLLLTNLKGEEVLP